MNRLIIVGVAATLLLLGCGDDSGAATTAASATSSTAASATAAPTTSITTDGSESTTSTSSTTSTTTTTTTTLGSTAPTLADGRPATFVGVTTDYLAVEVDTVTGEILHEFGQTGTAAEMAAAEEMPPNVLVGAWRTRDGSTVGLSDCCEPAAGRMFFLSAEGNLGPDPYSSSSPWNQGWMLSPSPVDNRFASVGYSLEVFDPEEPLEPGESVWIDDPSLGFPSSAAAWSRDGSRVYWIGLIEKVTALATLEIPGEPTHVTVLPWVGVHQSLDGIGSQASGNLVGFLHTRDDEFEVVATEGVVFSPTDGELLASFPVETNSWWGGYDASGRFLIYVDGDDTVRWQGVGSTGSLADGFIFASW